MIILFILPPVRAVALISTVTTKVGLPREAQRGKEAPSPWRTSYVPGYQEYGFERQLADQLSSTQWFTLSNAHTIVEAMQQRVLYESTSILKRSPLVQVSQVISCLAGVLCLIYT